MTQFWSLMKYIEENPAVGLVGVVIAYGLYRLLNRKPKLIRDADTRVEQLRKRGGDPYNKLRPPR